MFGGMFFELIVIMDVMLVMCLVCEEFFGFVGLVFCFEDEVEVIVMVNDIEYGLVVYFYICDYGCIWWVGEVFEYGMVGLNIGVIFNEVVLFGGVK